MHFKDNYALLRRIRDDADLKPQDKLIMLLLATYRNSKTSLCCPSQTTLAKASGYSQPTISRAINRLTTAGKLSRRPGPHSEYQFYPLIPDDPIHLSEFSPIHPGEYKQQVNNKGRKNKKRIVVPVGPGMVDQWNNDLEYGMTKYISIMDVVRE